jgi:exodeoxyribonuclease V alpha subunit
VFRQAAGSGIALNALRINANELPELKGFDDFFFFAGNDPERCAELVVELVATRIPRRFGYDPHRDIQVLSPVHRGPAGVTNLNRLLQERLNPATPGHEEVHFGSTIFRRGDRVIQIRNNYEIDVYNGDIGIVIAVDRTEQRILIQFEDEREVFYDFAMLDELALAYALSVHKSQGGEYPVIVLPLLMQHRALLQRNLLYTGITRARELVVLAGERRAIETAVRNDRIQRRFTGLTARLRGTPFV